MTDWQWAVAVALGIGGLIGGAEVLRRVGVPSAATRRGVHCGVALSVAAFPILFEGPAAPYTLAVCFVALNAFARGRRWWPSVHAARPRSWGTVAMPVAVIVALAATWTVDVDRVISLQAAFLIVGLADPVASWVGRHAESPRLTDDATVAGSGAFFGVSFAVSTGSLLLLSDGAFGEVLATALLLAVATTAAEMISRHGLDNLAIVLTVLLLLIPLHRGAVSTVEWGIALGGGIAFGVGARLGGLLAPSASVAGALFAATLIGAGGLEWVLPGLGFFGLSSALSLLPSGNSEPTAPHGSDERGRTLRQVLANGAVAWGLLGVYVLAPSGTDLLRMGSYVGFLGALAAAAADTWATEVGVRFAGRPWSLRTWARVDRGSSGAVTVTGTGAAFLGALSVVGAALVASPAGTAGNVGLSALVGGVAGMGADSLVGAFLQARYGDPEREIYTEEIGFSRTRIVDGWRFVDNAVVNLVGTAVGAGIAILIWGLLA